MGGPVRLKAIRIIEPRQQRSTVSASPTRWEYRVLIGARGFFSDRDLTRLCTARKISTLSAPPSRRLSRR